jgi:cardiolipin synthase
MDIDPIIAFLRDSRAWLFTLGHAVTAVIAGGHALLKKQEPRAAQVWLIICVFIPYLGPFAYFLFGINRIETRARRLREPPPEVPTAVAAPEDPPSRFASVGRSVLQIPASRGNAVRPLVNGESAYPAMLAAIDRAERYVYLASYIFSNDHIGKRFVQTLAQAQKRGVTVRVLVDAIGEWYSLPRIKREMARAAIPYRRFLPPRWFPPFGYVNLRTHRKLLIVDGAIGFTGGMNIGERHVMDRFGRRSADDVHFELRGPVVTELTRVFVDDWQFACDEVLNPEVAPEAPEGAHWCRVVPDGPNEDMDKLASVLQGAIANAERTVSIMTPYFLPERDLLVGLQTAALRGVDVRVVIPRRSNLPYVDWATRHVLPELARKGVRIFSREPFSHAKLFAADDAYALIGTANLDPRSLRLNFELGVEVFDAEFATQIRHMVCASGDLQVTSEALSQRSLPARLRDATAALFTPYL